MVSVSASGAFWRHILKAVPSVFLLSIVACASTSEYGQLKNEINDLRRAQFQQKEEVEEIRKRLSMSESKPGGGKSDVIEAFRSSQEATTSKVAHLTREMQQLQGRFEERKYYVDRTITENHTDRDVMKAQFETMENELKELQLKMNRIDSVLTQKGIALPSLPSSSAKTPESLPKATATQAPAPSASPAAENPPTEAGGARALYDEGYRDFQSGKYKEARVKFGRVIKDYSGSPLVANCHFWISESFYKEGNYEDAILSYDTLIKKYPDSDKVAAAKLKQALSFIEIKDMKTARTILQQVIDSYPKTPEAEEARKKIQTLSKPSASKPTSQKKSVPPKKPDENDSTSKH
ncbi:MAG: tol-pal system protein YbgF [Nitrospirae bacterium]|nr:tol-pal system protein YbgF [Nitrospirota bacterium]